MQKLGQNGTAMAQLNDPQWVMYYYQAAYLVKPSFEYLQRVIEEALSRNVESWKAVAMGLFGVLIGYCVLALAMKLFFMRYDIAMNVQYSSFYTILPVQLRLVNEQLRDYMKHILHLAE